MVAARQILKASLGAGWAFFRAPAAARALEKSVAEKAARRLSTVVPIRSLGEHHRERIAGHLLALSPDDRYLRFGYVASDEQIQRYVDGLDFGRDEIFGIYNRRLQLIAMAHLAFSGKDDGLDACAEFGVSVLRSARGRGYGARLFKRAAMHATNEGVALLFIHALSENAAMLSIARKAGATVERDGSESEAYLRLAQPTLDTRMAQLVEHQLAEIDYRLKVQARDFWAFLSSLQEVRSGVRAGRHRSGT